MRWGGGGLGVTKEGRRCNLSHKHSKNQEFLVYIHKINTYIYLYIFIYIMQINVERERVIENNIFMFPFIKKKQVGVSHCGLAIYIKIYLEAKEELWKLKYFIMQQYNLPKNPLKETKDIPQDIITL